MVAPNEYRLQPNEMGLGNNGLFSPIMTDAESGPHDLLEIYNSIARNLVMHGQALVEAVGAHVDDCFWARENRCPKN